MPCHYGNNNARYLVTMHNINDCYGVIITMATETLNFLVVCLCLVVSHYSLRYNRLTDTGAIVLATALQHNKSLEELK